MAAGCPVVAARSGGIPDIVTDGVNGYLFDPAEEEGAIAATIRLLAHQQERETLRQMPGKKLNAGVGQLPPVSYKITTKQSLVMDN
jgi:glycosyltransferase involved in cell wall biosynthesis